MTVVSPPLYLTVNGAYNGDALGLPARDFISGGVVGADDLEVTPGSAAMTVDIAAGVAWVPGTDNPDAQPVYRCRNDGTVNIALNAADGSNPRLDIVVAEVRDSRFSGSIDDWRLRVLTGTPAASPVEPSLPDNAIKLAVVTVAAGASAIVSGDIADARDRARVGDGNASLHVTSPHELRTSYYFTAADTSPPSLAPGLTWTPVTNYSDEDDPLDIFDATTGIFTVPVAGLWLIEAELKMLSRTGVMRLRMDDGSVSIPKYTGRVFESNSPSAYHEPGYFTTIIPCEAGTSFRLEIYSVDTSPNPIGVALDVNFKGALLSAT